MKKIKNIFLFLSMVVLIDSDCRQNLYPFTQTRHAADILIGALTIRQKWEMLLQQNVSINAADDGIKIPANIIPTKENYLQIIDVCTKNLNFAAINNLQKIEYPWHIFQLNDIALRADVAILTDGKTFEQISSTNTLISPENIFIADGAIIEHSLLNASTGPIFIDKNAIVMEGSCIRGPFYLGKNAVVKMGATIYGATTVGDNCTVGGEIKNSVLFANSNKAHGGYLGDSVVGEWCNLGAGTSNSNVKNTAGNVHFNMPCGSKINAGNKAGLIMGDYSRAAINTSFNTGTMIGVCCNIFGEKMPSNFVANFTWGNEKYIFEKALEHINNWMAFKQQILNQDTINKLKLLYEKI